MSVRDLIPEDYAQIQAIHSKMGMDYALPDLDSPLFLVKKVVTDENGKVIGASVVRLEAECYLWVDPEFKPRVKMDAMLELQPEILRSAWAKGLENLVAWIPLWMEKKFRRRLLNLGWVRDRTGWQSWSRPLVEPKP
jgi:hypothetical protein